MLAVIKLLEQTDNYDSDKVRGILELFSKDKNKYVCIRDFHNSDFAIGCVGDKIGWLGWFLQYLKYNDGIDQFSIDDLMELEFNGRFIKYVEMYTNIEIVEAWELWTKNINKHIIS